MLVRRKISLLLILITLITCFSFIIVNASSTHSEGEVYEENGKTYKIVNGTPYEVDSGSGSDQSITDQFNNYSSTTTPDSDTMTQVGGKITNTAGTIISVIIYLIFALTAFTTACDLLYIAIPPIRPYLYDGGSEARYGSSNANLLGRNGSWTQMANHHDMAVANQRQGQANAYAQRAQMQAAMGDAAGARHSMNMANLNQQGANRRARWANEDMVNQQRSDNTRGELNQQAMTNAQNRAIQNSK
jgi:hypothetical protein